MEARFSRSTQPSGYLPYLVGSCAVKVSPEVDVALQAAQGILASKVPGARIVLRRGCVNHGSARKLRAAIGRVVFRLVYPHRWEEVTDLFEMNGHDTGTGVDIGVLDPASGEEVPRLVLNVFTPKCLALRVMRRNQRLLTAVRNAMDEAGFAHHRNAIEALQMHFHLRP